MTTNTQDTVSAGLSIQLLGSPQIQVNGQPLPHLRSRKSLYLLALLTLRHDRAIEREWLAGILWPEVDPAQGSNNLRPVLSALREALGEESRRLLSPSRPTLALDLSVGVEADILVFDAAVVGGDIAALERAVALYRGPLLEGCTEEWITPYREAREQSCLRALQMLAEAATTNGDFDQATGYWQRAIAIAPLWETARRELMEVFAQRGNNNSALLVYRAFVHLLRRNDLRANPDEKTTALYRQLREQTRRKASTSAALTDQPEDSSASSISGYLPTSLTELIGREEECREIIGRLRHSRLIALIGPGGIGKTRLAVAVAGEVRREYPDGVWFVSLESLSVGGDIAEDNDLSLVRQLASGLGIREGSGGQLLSAVVEQLRRKRLLLILDNCEHLLGPCARVVDHLLRECQEVRILITSREALRVIGETVWSVPALAVPDPEHLPIHGDSRIQVMVGYDAVQLFIERAKAASVSFSLTEENAEEVASLCFRLGGIPLALELAAARTATFAPRQILEQLDAHPLDALASTDNDVAPRHRTLRATLNWSYSLLPPEARLFLADLGVFRGDGHWKLRRRSAMKPMRWRC